jgi:hypothetical protein
MADKNTDQDLANKPQYSIADIMELLDKNEAEVRKLIKKADVEIKENINDPTERISYQSYCKLWVSMVNRPEGKLLSTLLVEESPGNWLSRLLGNR